MPNLRFTLKAWPVITAVTIGLCYLTQTVGKLFGIDLPDQANVEIVKRYAGWNFNFAFLCLQIVVIMPAIEEFLFRWLPLVGARKLIVKSAQSIDGNRHLPVVIAVIASVLFSAAHYIIQPWPDAAFLALFFFGIAQCWLYRRTAHLWCSILNHSLFNLTNLILLFILPEAA